MYENYSNEAFIYFIDYSYECNTTEDYSFPNLGKAFKVGNDKYMEVMVYQYQKDTYSISFDEDLMIDITLRSKERR